MVLKADYYTSLSRSVAALDRDSYAARGTIYDREHKAMLRSLFAGDTPPTDDDIEREQQAFRAAVRRIEFGDDIDHVPLVPQRDASHDESAAAPADTRSAPTAARARRTDRDWAPEPVTWLDKPAGREPPRPPRKPVAEPAPVHWSQRTTSPEVAPASPAQPPPRKPAQQLPWQELEATLESARKEEAAPAAPTPPPPSSDTDATETTTVVVLKRKSILGRVLRRALLAAVLLGLAVVAYSVATGAIELPLLGKLAKYVNKGATNTDLAAAAPSQAIIYDSNPPNPDGSKGVGTAIWRTRPEPATPQRAASTALQLDLTIPERQITLSMSMRPEAAGSAMSHLIELKFLRPDGQPDPDVDNIASIVMTTVEQRQPRVLVGRVQKVAPGVFWFGLSNQAGDRDQNLRYLKDETWFDIPLTYRNGASGVLAVEKGEAGDQAVDQAMGEWARVAAAPTDR